MALYVWVWSSIIGNSLVAWWQRKLPEARWLLLFMLVNLLLNMDEGPLPYPDQFTVLMPGSILLLRSWRRERAFAASAAAALRRAAPLGAFGATKGMPQRVR